MQKIYNYHRPETGKDEQVPIEKYCWEARYLDDTILKQFDDEGNFHQFREINQLQLKVFRMINYDTGKFIDIDWHPSRKLIHQYKRVRNWNTNELLYSLYMFGYETHFNGATHKVIFVVMPDDNIVVTEDVNKIEIK
jgi:hypothetical protein